jgi:ferrous iron transport protein B
MTPASKPMKIALIGNPNTGKSSLCNHLTGLRQHVGNFPGVTVEKRLGHFTLPDGRPCEVLDMPGSYSIFPRSGEEKIVFDILTDTAHPDHPDLVVVLADASNLERNLLLFTQLDDLGLPLVLALTMPDIAAEAGIHTDTNALSGIFSGTPVLQVNARTGEGLGGLTAAIAAAAPVSRLHTRHAEIMRDMIAKPDLQERDARRRYAHIRSVLARVRHQSGSTRRSSSLPDRLAVHPVWGYVIFAAILLVVFQFIYNIASIPMDWIDGAFVQLSSWTRAHLPDGVFTNLLAEGILPGVGGVVVFIPQIALLFFFLALLEESGYMARVVFIMDKLVRPFGLSGKSVVPLMSSVACAIPGIMATRNISGWKDRLITIMVAPLMSCSARIPVFTLLIALVIPDQIVFGFFELQGLVLLGLYLMGIVSALMVAALLRWIIRIEGKSFLLMEMPDYRWPRWTAVGVTVLEKVRVFVFDAGKVILAISIILWALASFGPPGRMDAAAAALTPPQTTDSTATSAFEQQVAAVRLENSFIGIIGHGIEPAIRPLGFDWKIGIAIITSFAAREVFVGAMATIYSVGEDFEDHRRLVERLRDETNPRTGEKIYTLASGISLMVFYVFAMQCMATFAVVRRETNSWKWPWMQLIYMGVMAYIFSWIAFTLLS